MEELLKLVQDIQLSSSSSSGAGAGAAATEYAHRHEEVDQMHLNVKKIPTAEVDEKFRFRVGSWSLMRSTASDFAFKKMALEDRAKYVSTLVDQLRECDVLALQSLSFKSGELLKAVLEAANRNTKQYSALLTGKLGPSSTEAIAVIYDHHKFVPAEVKPISFSQLWSPLPFMDILTDEEDDELVPRAVKLPPPMRRLIQETMRKTLKVEKQTDPSKDDSEAEVNKVWDWIRGFGSRHRPAVEIQFYFFPKGDSKVQPPSGVLSYDLDKPSPEVPELKTSRVSLTVCHLGANIDTSVKPLMVHTFTELQNRSLFPLITSEGEPLFPLILGNFDLDAAKVNSYKSWASALPPSTSTLIWLGTDIPARDNLFLLGQPTPATLCSFESQRFGTQQRGFVSDHHPILATVCAKRNRCTRSRDAWIEYLAERSSPDESPTR